MRLGSPESRALVSEEKCPRLVDGLDGHDEFEEDPSKQIDSALKLELDRGKYRALNENPL